MHRELAEAQSSERFREWETRFKDFKEREQEEKVLFDRELFYAVQPAGRLGEMIEKYRGEFA
jgi:hypothetical protein